MKIVWVQLYILKTGKNWIITPIEPILWYIQLAQILYYNINQKEYLIYTYQIMHGLINTSTFYIQRINIQ